MNLRTVWALTQRELATNFFSPIAYIVAAMFLVASGYLFLNHTLVEGEEASLRPMFDSMSWLLALAVPLLTMRSLADEFATGSIEALMTAPVSDVEVVVGKFLGGLAFFVALLVTTLLHAVILSRFGAADAGVLLLGYLGMVLLGGLYVAVGVFASSLSRYQLISAIIGIGILCTFTMIVDAIAGWRGGAFRSVLGYVNVLGHFGDFSKGILDTKSLVFFGSGTLFFLFLTVKVLESRRWR